MGEQMHIKPKQQYMKMLQEQANKFYNEFESETKTKVSKDEKDDKETLMISDQLASKF